MAPLLDGVSVTQIGAPLSLSSASQKRAFYHVFACGASMKGLAFKAPSGVLLHPQPKVPRGILEPRSAGARTHALGGVFIGVQTAR